MLEGKNPKKERNLKNRVRQGFLIILGLILAYIWAYFLQSGNMGGGLLGVYVLIGYLLSAVYLYPERDAHEMLVVAGGFGVCAAVLDIITMAVLFQSLVWVAFLDSVLKIGLSILGGLVYLKTLKFLNSRRQFIFTTTGVLIRRILAGVVDLHLLFALVFCVSYAMSVSGIFPGPGLLALLVTLILFLYKAVPEASEGETPGKAVFRVKVEGDWRQAVIRNLNILLFGVSLFPAVTGTVWVGLIYAVIFLDAVMVLTGRRLFDFAASTRVGKK